MNDDSTLLRRFLSGADKTAFAELTRRHMDMVYHAALRRCGGNTQLAQEAAQDSFILLARRAPSLIRHPSLAGWLHACACNSARVLLRAELRRKARETNATLSMQNPETHDQAWTRLRPFIDEVLLDLPLRDRELVLLRFFEGKTFADIATLTGTGENAARMRVTRALDNLQGLLSKRGVASSSALLSSALLVPASIAAPAGLAGNIAELAYASMNSTGATAAGTGLLTLMVSTKTLLITSAAMVLACAGGIALWTRPEASDKKQEVLQHKVKRLEARVAAEKRRADEAEVDNGTLLAIAAKAQQEALAPTASPALTREEIQARFNLGRTLAKNGENEAALRELLWCFDLGMRQADGAFFLTRYTALLDSLVELGRQHPEALQALRTRRDAAEQRLRQSPTDRDAGKDFSQINRVLGEADRTLVLFDSLPAEDPRRGYIFDAVQDRLLAAQRYPELAQAMPYSEMRVAFEHMVNALEAPAPSEEQRLRRLRGIVGVVCSNIEVRAGAGELQHAADLINRLLAVDNSPETRQTLLLKLQRAGHPELLPE